MNLSFTSLEEVFTFVDKIRPRPSAGLQDQFPPPDELAKALCELSRMSHPKVVIIKLLRTVYKISLIDAKATVDKYMP